MNVRPTKEPELRMTLMEHLEELRSRLGRAVLAVLLVGGASLFFARDLFWFLMKPVLAALPETQRALVYTSGIEEINVLIKVGLYSGIFFGSPVLLYQLWRFVSPGLLPNERKMAAPFVLGGTLFFVGGAAFCYLAILPTMFQFLLRPSETTGVRERVVVAAGAADDAMRLIAVGRAAQATRLVEEAEQRLNAPGQGKVGDPSTVPAAAEVRERLRRLSARFDLAASSARDDDSREAMVQAVTARVEAQGLLDQGNSAHAARRADDSAEAVSRSLAASSGAEAGPAFRALWALDRRVAAGDAVLAMKEWTRPMLTMREQLSLVLFLELTLGLIFELPLIMALLAAVGLVKAAWLAKYQRHAFMVCVVVAAVITPTGDIVNLTLVGGPMFLCYELGLLFAHFVGKRREARERGEEQALAASGQ